MICAKCVCYFTASAKKQIVLRSTNITEDEWKTYTTVHTKFNAFPSEKNVTFEHDCFNQRNQLEGEMAEQYITTLYNLAETWNYDELKGEMIRD